MTTQLAMWGNSLALRIPENIVAEANVEDGDAVDVSVEHGAIVVRATVRRYTIEELVAGMSPDNLHGETEWGPPVGKVVKAQYRRVTFRQR